MLRLFSTLIQTPPNLVFYPGPIFGPATTWSPISFSHAPVDKREEQRWKWCGVHAPDRPGAELI